MKASADQPDFVHVVPVSVLLLVFAVLMTLTGLTVAATWVDLGAWNVVAAMVIATVKAVLVALYFMHLRYDSPFHSFLFVAGLAFVALFLALTLVDIAQIQPAATEFRLLNPR